MAIFHLHVNIIGRSAGRSSVAAAAYRAGEKLQVSAVDAASYRSGEQLHDRQSRVTHDYTRKRGVVHTEIILPDKAPREFLDRATLWNAVEQSEKRRDARTARQIDIALPTELDRQEQIELIRKYVKENFVNPGMCADIAIHDKNDGNPHAHIMFTTRRVSESGFGKKERSWDKVERLQEWRVNWANACNERFRENGLDVRIDHRTLEAQGYTREPTIHVGRSKEREQLNQEIIRRNESRKPAAVAKYMNELQEKYATIDKYIKESAEKQREADRLDSRANDMTMRVADISGARARLDEAKKERDSMKFWQSKDEIDARINDLTNVERYYRDSFICRFSIEPETASNEIQRLRIRSEAIRPETKTTKDYAKFRDTISSEYQKQLLLAEIRPDSGKILNRLKTPPAQLSHISEEKFRQIIRDVSPTHAQILTKGDAEKLEQAFIGAPFFRHYRTSKWRER